MFTTPKSDSTTPGCPLEHVMLKKWYDLQKSLPTALGGDLEKVKALKIIFFLGVSSTLEGVIEALDGPPTEEDGNMEAAFARILHFTVHATEDANHEVTALMAQAFIAKASHGTPTTEG